MPQISAQEFERLQLRVHNFLAGVPLMTCGPSICRVPGPVSRWMSFCARQARVRADSRRKRERF